MIVDKNGKIFENRRKSDRRRSEYDIEGGRRKTDRRKEENKTKKKVDEILELCRQGQVDLG